jgi:hypothetical protein
MGQSSLLWSASHGFEVAARRNKTEQSIVHISTIIRPNFMSRSCGGANGNNVSEVGTDNGISNLGLARTQYRY